jgi:hypothetical protein
LTPFLPSFACRQLLVATFQKQRTIRITVENVLAAITPIEHVVKCSLKLDSQLPRHVPGFSVTDQMSRSNERPHFSSDPTVAHGARGHDYRPRGMRR